MRLAHIIYGRKSGIFNRLVVCDSLLEFAQGRHVGPDEDVIAVDEKIATAWSASWLGDMPDQAACYRIIEAKRGKPSESNRCIVIDDKTGNVVDVKLADPYFEKVEGGTLFQHPEASVGWELDAQKGEWIDPKMVTEGDAPADVPADTVKAKT